MDDNKSVAVDAFVVYASGLSEDQYCAGWLIGWEHYLWEALEDPGSRYPQARLTEREAATLRWLREGMRGWATWSHNEDGYTWWPLDEFRTLHERWREECDKVHEKYGVRLAPDDC